jgi:hypothetical protein
MTRGVLAASLLGLALTACAAAREPSPASPPPRAERPVYAVGDRWIQSEGVYDLIHQLLGWVYERTGLPDLAAEAFAEAQFLSTRAP